jgi:hypothetical protein
MSKLKKEVETPLLERMRAEVLELEIKARKWKAEYEIMLYMMEADKITPQYQEFMKAKKENIDKIAAELSKQATEVEVVTENSVENE